MSYDWIWKKIDDIVKKHKTSNPFELAEACNYYPVFDPVMKKWGRFIRTGKFDGAIFINANLSQHMKLLVGGHELGHGVLGHPTGSIFDERLLCVRWFNMVTEEHEAHLFAIHLLCKGYDWSHGNLQLAAKETGIPMQLLEQYVLARGIDHLTKKNKHKRTKEPASKLKSRVLF
jgi:Zn-dependent peptidase ImmA (M78 family)